MDERLEGEWHLAFIRARLVCEIRPVIWTWECAIAFDDADLARLLRHLSTEERERSDRFVSPAARSAYICARAALRVLLGRVLDRPPVSVDIQKDGHGKPFLAAPQGKDLSCNLSHSGELVLLALSDGRPVGIDIEAKRPLHDMAALAEKYFSAEESRLVAAGGPAGEACFFRNWSRREALAKAMGLGLGLPFARIGLPPSEVEGAFAPEIDWHDAPPGPWWVQDLPVAAGYSAAVSWRGGIAPIRRCRLQIGELCALTP